MGRKKLKKPERRSTRPVRLELKQWRETPNGGKAARCQAVKKNGEQCGSTARKGFDVCWMHGAGSRKREEEGRAKPAGRPPITGRYSRKAHSNVLDIANAVLETDADLENSDNELAIAIAVVQKALLLEPDIDRIRDALDAALKDGAWQEDPNALRDAARMLLRAQQYMFQLQEIAGNVIRYQKLRADAASKNAEARVLKRLVEDVHAIREVLHDNLEPDAYDRIYQQIVVRLRVSRGIEIEES